MPVGVALSELRRLLRAEVGQSLNPAQGVNAQGQYDLTLARQQQELWEAYDWQHLAFYLEVPINAGQSVYDYPTDMKFDTINSMWAKFGGGLNKLLYGLIVSADDKTRGTPERWGNAVKITGGKVVPDGQYRLQPTPDQNGILRMVGQAPCNPLIADDDICVLDSTVITMFAAAEILAAQKAENASLKLQKAQQYLRRLLANQSSDKREVPVLSGGNIAAAMAGPERRFRTPHE